MEMYKDIDAKQERKSWNPRRIQAGDCGPSIPRHQDLLTPGPTFVSLCTRVPLIGTFLISQNAPTLFSDLF